jgi:hypothetical protein
MARGDAEIAAMEAMVAALQDLDEDARGRVLEWTAKRFRVTVSGEGRRGGTGFGRGRAGGREEDEREPDREYRDLADLLDVARPSDDNQRALVAGYWFQIVEGGGSFSGQQTNDALKDTGNGLPNVTRSLDRLQSRDPALVRQVGKSGRSRQARKTYRLTTSGIRAVEAMVSGAAESEDGGE